ncbi:MAG: propanediol utilization protein, partial [Clostridia bacterium]|nr:propanediol utilization protein [Clostridia bacterium]
MKDNALRSAVTRAVLTELAAGGEFWAPVATSSRHCHLSPADLERLFGRPLTPLRM